MTDKEFATYLQGLFTVDPDGLALERLTHSVTPVYDVDGNLIAVDYDCVRYQWDGPDMRPPTLDQWIYERTGITGTLTQWQAVINALPEATFCLNTFDNTTDAMRDNAFSEQQISTFAAWARASGLICDCRVKGEFYEVVQ